MKGIGNREVECIFCNGCLSTTVDPGLSCTKILEKDEKE
jgi:hypothetical protein